MKTQRKFSLCAALLAAATLFLACTNGTQSAPPPPESNALTIKFDSTVACKKGYSGNEGDVTTGAEVKEGEDYKFTALLNPGETVKYWIVNGNPKTYATETTFSYTVRATDISSDNKLTVSFVKN